MMLDDPNLPSKLAMPLLGYDGYDTEVGAQAVWTMMLSAIVLPVR